MKKFLPALLLALFLFGCTSAPVKRDYHKNETPQPTPSIETTEDIVSSESVFDVPENWGKLLSKEPYKFEDYLHIDTPINDVYRLTFGDGTEAMYQTGVDVLYWVRKIDSGTCDIYAKYNTEPGHFEDCAYSDHPTNINVDVYQDGFYNLKTKQLTVLRSSVLPYKPAALLFLYKDKYNLFSPEGKYIVLQENLYEGCGGSLTSVNEYRIFHDTLNCDLKLDFSTDEDVVSIQSQYSGMASPLSDFILLKGVEEVHLLKLLALNPDNMTGYLPVGKVDVRNVINIDSVGFNTVIFTVSDEAKDWLKTGQFKFDFRNGDLSKM